MDTSYLVIKQRILKHVRQHSFRDLASRFHAGGSRLNFKHRRKSLMEAANLKDVRFMTETTTRKISKCQRILYRDAYDLGQINSRNVRRIGGKAISGRWRSTRIAGTLAAAIIQQLK